MTVEILNPRKLSDRDQEGIIRECHSVYWDGRCQFWEAGRVGYLMGAAKGQRWHAARMLDIGADVDLPNEFYQMPKGHPKQTVEMVLPWMQRRVELALFHATGAHPDNCAYYLRARYFDKSVRGICLGLHFVNWYTWPGDTIVCLGDQAGMVALSCLVSGRNCVVLEPSSNNRAAIRERLEFSQDDENAIVRWMAAADLEALAVPGPPRKADGPDAADRWDHAQKRLRSINQMRESMREIHASKVPF